MRDAALRRRPDRIASCQQFHQVRRSNDAQQRVAKAARLLFSFHQRQRTKSARICRKVADDAEKKGGDRSAP
jgi:hypothetical protein